MPALPHSGLSRSRQIVLSGEQRSSGPPPPGPNGLLNGLVSYWKFEESSGDRADSIGSNILTDVASDIGRVAGLFPSTFAAYNTDFASGNLINSSTTGISTSGDFAFQLWLRIPLINIGRASEIFQVTDVDNSEDVILAQQVPNDDTSSTILLGNDGPTFSFSAIADTWHHIIFSGDYDGNIVAVYANGVRLDDGSMTFPQDLPSLILSFFNHEVPGDGFIGFLDESAWWNRQLSPTDVANLFNSNAGLPLSGFTN
jgi:hypothetical protein